MINLFKEKQGIYYKRALLERQKKRKSRKNELNINGGDRNYRTWELVE